MQLKTYPRTEYKKNILAEVIFQARFPQIIKIANEPPVNFQEKIRKKGFPETSTKKAGDISPADLPDIRKVWPGDDEYGFFSEDKVWQIGLTKDFIALSCRRYENYTAFEEHLKTMMEIFWEEYTPGYFNRVGLRYRNLANRTTLGIDKDIRGFVPPHIAPGLQEPIRDQVQAIEQTLQLRDEVSTVNIRYLYGQLSGEFGTYNLNDEYSYVIDIDCFTTEKIREVKHAIDTSGTFNRGNIRNIFQWSITDSLREAMEPASGKN